MRTWFVGHTILQYGSKGLTRRLTNRWPLFLANLQVKFKERLGFSDLYRTRMTDLTNNFTQ